MRPEATACTSTADCHCTRAIARQQMGEWAREQNKVCMPKIGIPYFGPLE